MKTVRIILFLLVTILLPVLYGCTIMKTYGPYNGKVVETETEVPIEGAVVHIFYTTDTWGGYHAFAGYVETLTDSKGEFHIPSHTIVKVRILAEWDELGSPTIFKPGYGCYSDLADSKSLLPSGEMLKGEFEIIKLPKLKTVEERKKNLINIFYKYPTEDDEFRTFLIYKAEQEERRVLGFGN